MNPNNETVLNDFETLSHEDLLDAYEKLADSYKKIKILHETEHQVCYELKRSNQVLTSSEIYLQNELESINIIHNKELDEVRQKNINILEDIKEKNHELLSDNSKLENKNEDLNSRITDLEYDIEMLKARYIEEKPRPRISDVHPTPLEQENENLQLVIDEIRENMEAISDQNKSYLQQLEELKEKVMCLEDNLESKKLELDEKNESLEALQDKITELTVEMAIYKSAPEDANRKGNSLFAEVDDQRQQMKSILHNQKIHYMEMKKAYNAKDMEIRRLKRENCNIKQEIQACSNLFKRSDQVLLQSLNSRVSQLLRDNRNLEQLLATAEKNFIELAKTQNIDWIESLLVTSNNDTRDLKDKLYQCLLEKSSLGDILQKTQKELAKYRLDGVKLKILLGRLVDENNIKINETNYMDIGIDSEFLESLKQDDNKGAELSPDMIGDESVCDELGENTMFLITTKRTFQQEFAMREEKPQEVPKIREPVPENTNCYKDLNKENCVTDKFSFVQPSAVKPLTEKKTNFSPEIIKTDDIKSVKFSEVNETKSIDETQEQFEQSKLARKKAPVMIKRINIPSRANRSANIQK
ncbi:unnamed protein product [Diamesa hyperborea]